MQASELFYFVCLCIYLGTGKDKILSLVFVLLSLKNNPQFILYTLRLDQLTN